ncbi:MAG: thiamine pyrophosphate-binding protein [Burkholderiales bacterium]|nr:thiamine pyrophosphate-binding protein [Burkholderiales bacterium]
MLVIERVARAFAAEGVTEIFGMMGSSTKHWYQALDRERIKIFNVRHEGFALAMADGYARSSGRVGACTATEGPGLTQFATALMTASRARSALVALVSDCDRSDTENVHNMDQRRFVEACEGGFTSIDSALMVDALVRETFYRARLESRPMVLSIRHDVQMLEIEDDGPYQPSTAVLPARQRLRPDGENLGRAADIVAASRKPVIIAGRGAISSGAGAAVLALAERIGALVGTSLRGRNFLADAAYQVGIAGLYGTRTSFKLFEEADCVIAVGATMNRYTTAEGLLFADARVVQIDSAPHVVMGSGRVADCYIQADASAAIEALEDELARRSVRMTGFRTPQVRERLAGNYDDARVFDVEPGCVDAREVCRMLNELVPGDIALATAGGAAGGFTHMLLNRPRPFVLSGPYFGTPGQMLPVAMGAVLANGCKPMLLLEGDAGMMMVINDFDTAVRYDIPLLAVVLNDQALGIEYHMMTAAQMDAGLSIVPSPDMGAVAAAMGGRGRLARSVGEVRAAVEEWLARPGPMVIDVRISRNVVPIPMHRMLYAEDV